MSDAYNDFILDIAKPYFSNSRAWSYLDEKIYLVILRPEFS